MEDILVPIGFFALVGLLVWIVTSARLKAATVQANTVGRLIDKLGTSQEVMAYLESETGKKLIDSLTTTRFGANPYSRILGAASTGIVFSVLGLGLMALAMWFPGADEAIGGGIMALALGIAFLIAAGLSYRLSKSWGLLDGASARSRSREIDASVGPGS